MSGKFRSALEDTRVYRGADVDSDHLMVIAKIKVKLNSTRSRRNQQRKIDVAKMKNDDCRAQYQVEVRNRFDLLPDECAWNEHSGLRRPKIGKLSY